MERSEPARRPRPPGPLGRAVRAVGRRLWRIVVSSFHALGVAGCRLAAIPIDDSGEPAVPVAGDGPPPGHPERVGTEALTEAEIEIWGRLGGAARWPL